MSKMKNVSGKPCKAKNANGKPCGGFAVAGSAFCFMHDPKRGRARAQARKRGGEHRRRSKSDVPWPEGTDVKTACGLQSFLEVLMRETWKLENSVTRSRTLGYLCLVQKNILEVGELEQRLARIEEMLEADGKKPSPMPSAKAEETPPAEATPADEAPARPNAGDDSATPIVAVA